MSQQINLYDAALRRKRELLTAGNLALAALVLLLALGGWGASVRSRVAALEAEKNGVTPQVTTLQDLKGAIEKQLATVKPDPRLEAELVAARVLATVRGEILAALRRGVGADSTGFAEYLRGLARQSQSGLWLTGFSVAENGKAMEIRGRMSDPALLPEYIRRLNGEKAFRGHAFSALNISSGPMAAAPGAVVATPVAAAGRAPFHEFVLIPAVDVPGAAMPSSAAADEPAQLASATPGGFLPPAVASDLDKAGRQARESMR